MSLDYIDVDVRPILRAGGEPFSVIMAALARLEPGQGVRLYATFKPTPLFGVMADKGFAHSEKELDGGEWEVIFTPAGIAPAASPPAIAGFRCLAGSGRPPRHPRSGPTGTDGENPRRRRKTPPGRDALGAASSRAGVSVSAA